MIESGEKIATGNWPTLPAAGRSGSGTIGGRCLSFAPAAGAHFPGVWEYWTEQVYGAELVGAMLGVMSATRLDHTRELLALDATLNGVFSAETVERLRLAGHAMLQRMDGMRGSRSAQRLRAAAERGESPGLFPIVFALQAALYNVPARAALLAYARLEWRAAREAHGGPWDEPEGTAVALVIAEIDMRLQPSGESDEVAAAV